MNKLLIGLAFLTLWACDSKNKATIDDTLSNKGDAKWIGDGKQMPSDDSLFYLNDPSPLFRKEFNVINEAKSARLIITAAGYYKANINGENPAKNMLEPAWTDFGKRIYYSDYDITKLLNQGPNCIGVTLGNGFYNPLPLRMWGRRNLREVLDVGRPVFIGKIIIEYKNGDKEILVTDNSWRFSYGPVMKNNVFLGEVYDARQELKGWNKPGFDDSAWENAVLTKKPGGKLQKAFFPPVQITQRITPVNIYSPREDIYIADMGVNFAGGFRMKLKGQTGDSITFRFGERIYPNGNLNPMTTVCGQIKRPGMGGPEPLDTAWQADTYIFGDTAEVWYQPEFTFHTYRYMEISGLEKKPETTDIEGLFLHSNIPNNNRFSSSSALLNSIQEATERTFRSNLISVQLDCLAAREKFGYGGDLNATSEAFIYNFDMKLFYRKTVYDWVDAMNDSVFVDTAPYVGIHYCGLSWESAFSITQYYLYLYYNDVDFVEEMYDLNKKWMEKAAGIHPGGIVNKGLGDHESMKPVPVELTGTCHYLLCAKIMKEFAEVMGDQENKKQYDQLAKRLKELILAKFWNNPVKEEMNKQTLFASLLYYDIIPSGETDAAVDSLLKAVENGPSGHFTTGIFGTKYILEAMSQYASPDKVFDIVNSTAFPGWGYMIDNGATTLWETWKESDNTYSNCHPMFGTVSEWFYRWLEGIKPDPKYPGFKRFRLTPAIPEGLDHVKCTYQSPFGEIGSSWKKENGTCTYRFIIPKGTTASLNLRKKASQKITIEKSHDKGFEPVQMDQLKTGHFKLREGKYIITVK